MSTGKRHLFLRSLFAVTALVTPAMVSAQDSNQDGSDAKTGKKADPSKSAASPTVTLSGKVNPEWGNIRAFWGNIRAFSGDVNPFWGNIRAFWGPADPFAANAVPFWGNIRAFGGTTTTAALTAPSSPAIEAFWGNVGPQWGNIRAFWGSIDTNPLIGPLQYPALAGQLRGLVATSQATWGAAVQAQTGQSFDVGFANPLLAKYGIDLNNPQSLAKLDADTREHFMVDWYDGLMNFSGRDHVDHWMREVNWTPALTQTLGSGASTTIGLLDFSVTGDTAKSVIAYSGVSTVANGHGTAVASLMVDPMDGKGVMGIAPEAKVVTYNPFDATQTASWADIATGVKSLAASGANVINMSLGVPGWTLHQNWNQVFADKDVQKIAQNALFVIAAGNDGIAQTTDLAWSNHNPVFIVVGSVDPNGQISTFSNTPGTACLLDKDNSCQGDYLKNHFIVAPGELILVSDGKGGVTRVSGTSFAAPLVSGTIALIQDRWPWLKGNPGAVATLLFSSARHLGDPGINATYGYGELDVGAALSPLNLNNLVFKIYQNGKITDISAGALQSSSAATRATWEATGAYVAAFEKLPGTGDQKSDIQRDFEIPLSSRLANQTIGYNGAQVQFMSYLTSRFTTWLGVPKTLVDGSVRMGFTDLAGVTTPLRGFGDVTASVSMRIRPNRVGFKTSGVPVDTAFDFASPGRGVALSFGNGDRAATLAGQGGFAMTSDYDVYQGGANPFLGFASGDGFGRVEVRLAPGLTVASGFSQRGLRPDLQGLPDTARREFGALAPYAARAATMTVNYAATPRLSGSLGYTQLHEDHALLGMESTSPGDLPNGSTSDAATAGASFALTPSLALSATGTAGRTRPGDASQSGIAIGRAGLVSSAYQLALSKDHLFGRSDHVRISFAQPMHIERGSLNVTTVGVVDRQTGEIGPIVQSAALVGASRRHVGELIYGRSVMHGLGEVRLFGRATIDGADHDLYPALTMGSSMKLAF